MFLIFRVTPELADALGASTDDNVVTVDVSIGDDGDLATLEGRLLETSTVQDLPINDVEFDDEDEDEDEDED